MNTRLLSKWGSEKQLVPTELNRNNFDLLRFLLATGVIYSHCFVIFYGKMEDVEPLRVLSRNQLDFGGMAVSFFFVISGFLIVRSFEYSRSTYAYFIKRLLRIVPGFFVAFLISVFVLGLIGTATSAHPWGDVRTYFSGMSKKRIPWQLFTLEAPKGAKTFGRNPLPDMINESLWTIQYEAICYMLVPLLGLVGMMKRKSAALVSFLLAYGLLMLQELNVINLYSYDNIWNWFVPYPSELPRLFAFFFAGACVYLYRHRMVRNQYLALLAIASLIVTSPWPPFMKLMLPIAGTYLLFYVAYHPRIQFHQFAKRGDFSYGLYLYGWPIQQVIMYFLAPHLNAHRLFLIAFAVTFLAAYGSWHLVEAPFLKMKGKLRKHVVVTQKRAVSV